MCHVSYVMCDCSGEEPKMEDEPLKILGSVKDNKFVRAEMGIR